MSFPSGQEEKEISSTDNKHMQRYWKTEGVPVGEGQEEDRGLTMEGFAGQAAECL